MVKRIASAVGMVLLGSSFSLAGQSSSSPTAPWMGQRVTTHRQHTQTLTHRRGEKQQHHKKHKHQTATQKSQKR